MRQGLRSGGGAFGGALGYPCEQLFEEVAYLAYYFHWPHAEIMQMRHLERLGWVEQVANINKRLNEAGDSGNFG
jgi:hypothetical protein